MKLRKVTMKNGIGIYESDWNQEKSVVSSISALEKQLWGSEGLFILTLWEPT